MASADRLTRWTPDLKRSPTDMIVEELMRAISIRVFSGAVERTENGEGEAFIGEFSGFASTADPDHDKWVLPVNGFMESMPIYMSNPMGLFNHNSDHIVFKTKGFDPRVNGLHIHAQMDMEDEFARSKAGQVNRGFLRAMSVGFLPLEEPKIDTDRGQLLFGRMHLLEISLVSIPANPHALLDSRSAQRVQRWMGGSLQPMPTPKRKARGIGFTEETRIKKIVADAIDERLSHLATIRKRQMDDALRAVDSMLAASLAADISSRKG